MANLISLNFQNDPIRTFVQDDIYYFCLADICKILNLKNPTHTANQIKEEFGCPTLNVGHIKDSLNRTQSATFITEPQLYYIMNRSNAKNARNFRMWVNCEVLPQIRKHGTYVNKEVEEQLEYKKPWYVEQLLALAKRYTVSEAALKQVISITERAWKQGYAIAMSKKESETEASSNSESMFSNTQISNLYELANNIKNHEQTLLRFGKDVADFGQVLIEMSHIINYVAEGSVITLSDIRHTIEKHQKGLELKKAS